MIFDMCDAEEKLGYVFKDKEILRRAFTHSSYANENQGNLSNEIFEFFGDSILGFVVKEQLCREHPEKDEGDLTVICQSILSTQPLASAVLRLRLNDDLLLGVGELKNRDNLSICEDLFEACVAAIYWDGGLEPARRFILTALAPEIVASLIPREKRERAKPAKAELPAAAPQKIAEAGEPAPKKKRAEPAGKRAPAAKKKTETAKKPSLRGKKAELPTDAAGITEIPEVRPADKPGKEKGKRVSRPEPRPAEVTEVIPAEKPVPPRRKRQAKTAVPPLAEQRAEEVVPEKALLPKKRAEESLPEQALLPKKRAEERAPEKALLPKKRAEEDVPEKAVPPKRRPRPKAERAAPAQPKQEFPAQTVPDLVQVVELGVLEAIGSILPRRSVSPVKKPPADPKPKPSAGRVPKQTRSQPKQSSSVPKPPADPKPKQAEKSLPKQAAEKKNSRQKEATPIEPALRAEAGQKDAKSLVSELMQRAHRPVRYETESREGPDHDPVFRVKLIVDGEVISRGVGKSKKGAEMDAAERGLPELSKRG